MKLFYVAFLITIQECCSSLSSILSTPTKRQSTPALVNKTQDPEQCGENIFGKCAQPYDSAATHQFACQGNSQCPKNFKCCQNSCFSHNICVEIPSKIPKQSQNCQDRGFQCDQPYFRAYTFIFECETNTHCPKNFICCPQKCFSHKVCVKDIEGYKDQAKIDIESLIEERIGEKKVTLIPTSNVTTLDKNNALGHFENSTQKSDAEEVVNRLAETSVEAKNSTKFLIEERIGAPIVPLLATNMMTAPQKNSSLNTSSNNTLAVSTEKSMDQMLSSRLANAEEMLTASFSTGTSTRTTTAKRETQKTKDTFYIFIFNNTFRTTHLQDSSEGKRTHKINIHRYTGGINDAIPEEENVPNEEEDGSDNVDSGSINDAIPEEENVPNEEEDNLDFEEDDNNEDTQAPASKETSKEVSLEEKNTFTKVPASTIENLLGTESSVETSTEDCEEYEDEDCEENEDTSEKINTTKGNVQESSTLKEKRLGDVSLTDSERPLTMRKKGAAPMALGASSAGQGGFSAGTGLEEQNGEEALADTISIDKMPTKEDEDFSKSIVTISPLDYLSLYQGNSRK